MNEPKPDAITVPLDDRLPPHYRETIDQLFGRNCLLESELRRLTELNEYLLRAVDLLSLPRVTDDDVLFVRDGLLALRLPKEIRH